MLLNVDVIGKIIQSSTSFKNSACTLSGSKDFPFFICEMAFLNIFRVDYHQICHIYFCLSVYYVFYEQYFIIIDI